MWHEANIVPPEGFITIDLGGDYVQAYVCKTPISTYLHTEPGVDFTWREVKRWTEVPLGAVEFDGNEICYRLQ